MIRHRTFVLLVSAAAAAVVVGCQSKKQPTQTQQSIQPAVMTDTSERMSELQKKSGQLSSIVKQLPGRDAKEDRRLVADAFDATHDSLTMMAGPEPGGAMRQQLRIIENIRQFLRTGDQKLSYDPAVDAGLRATHSALEGVRERLFPNDQKVTTLVNEFGTRLSELDQVRGPMHSVVVAEVFQSASTAIDAMGSILNTRSQMVSQYSAPSSAAPTPPAPTAPPAAPRIATPAAASTPPSAPTPPAHAAAASPAAAPAPAAVAPPPPPAAPPAAAAAPSPQPTSEQYQQLQKQNEDLQQQLQQLQQQQQQQQGQPAAAPVPPPAPESPAQAAPPPAPAPAADLNK